MSGEVFISDIGDDDVAKQVTSQPQSPASTFTYVGANELLLMHDWYQQYHGFLATAVCLYGITANTLNIIVLTQRNMLSATNCILTGLAVSDGLTMAAYLPFALRFYVLYGLESNPERNSLAAIQFMWFFACFSVVVHSVSIWLTVVLAIFRYISIEYPRAGATWCTVSRAQLSVLLVYMITFVICVPNFATTTIASRPFRSPADCRYGSSVDVVGVTTSSAPPSNTRQRFATNTTSHCNSSASQINADGGGLVWVVTLRQDTDVDQVISSLNFWIQAVVVKLIPCCGLVVLSALLMRALRAAETRRRLLRGREGRCDRRGKANSRTTRMLLLVVVLFLLTEFPQGIANLLNGVLDGFFDEIYVSLGDLIDILALVNNGVNFVLYCTMSKQFRDTFTQLFVVDQCRRSQLLVPTRCIPKDAACVRGTAVPLRPLSPTVGNDHGGIQIDGLG